MKSIIVIMLLGIAALSGCGVLKTLDPFFDDEEAGTPVRPLDEPVPGRSDLPTPADASKINPDWSIFSSIGFYSHGRLWSHWEVKSNHLWNVRKRTVDNKMNFMGLYAYQPVTDAASAFYKRETTADTLEFWDMSHRFGGKRAGHISHANGGDLDIKAIYLADSIDYQKMWSLALSFVETGKVQRILTDAAIKKKLCKLSKTDSNDERLKAETLRRLRPWPGHTDHFHVRLFCDERDKLCVPQTEPPKGNGC